MIDRCRKCGRIVSAADPNVRYDRRGWAHRICRSRKLKRGERKRRRIALISKKGWNLEATAAREFSDPRSRVMQDGREILFEDDYRLRVAEVLERDNHKCQWPTGPACNLAAPWAEPNYKMVCGAPANQHPHHIKHRWPKRDDRAQNLMSICDPHNVVAHPEKQTQFKEAKCQT
jgi:hypothetical protein